jgi:hypothetical protein
MGGREEGRRRRTRFLVERCSARGLYAKRKREQERASERERKREKSLAVYIGTV